MRDFIKAVIKTGAIDNAKKIWWDIRPHRFSYDRVSGCATSHAGG